MLRLLPQRPPLLRGNSTEVRLLRNSPLTQRRLSSFQRSSSNAGSGRRLLPRQSSIDAHRALPNPRTFRRYGDQSESEKRSVMALIEGHSIDQGDERRIHGCDRQERSERRVGWTRASFQRSLSLETQPVDFSQQRRLTLQRQEDVEGSSSLPDLLEERKHRAFK